MNQENTPKAIPPVVTPAAPESVENKEDTITLLTKELKQLKEQNKEIMQRLQENKQPQQQWEQYEQRDLSHSSEIIVEAKEVEDTITMEERLSILNKAEEEGWLKALFPVSDYYLNGDLSNLYFLSRVAPKYMKNVDIAKDYTRMKRVAHEALNKYWLTF